MNFQQRHYDLLVVSASESFRQAMEETFLQMNVFTAQHVTSIAAAKRITAERKFDLMIVNTPLADEFGSRFAAEASVGKGIVVLLIVKNDIYEEVFGKVLDSGVYVLPKPMTRITIQRALKWMCATKERLRCVEKKSFSLEEKMEEIRIVNRAKWLLIGNLKMTEADAHRYIEKQAMDTCVSRKTVAENIIKTYS